MHVSMYFEHFRKGNAVNTGVPGPKVPIYRKLGFYIFDLSVYCGQSILMPILGPCDLFIRQLY
jgi:hypothetical protein